MNTAEITACMARIAGNYPHFHPTDEMVLLWQEAFATTPAMTVMPALGEWINTEEYPPTIAGIRSKMRENASAQARELAWTSRPEPNEVYLDFATGRAIAAAAYERDCQEQGKEPNWHYFDRAIGGAV